jgi:ATP-dependent protease HslVU (ClpYQ) peptidase subunit
MSVVVWDGKTLAADKQMSNGNLRRTGRKIWKHKDTLIGGTGNAVPIQALLNWYMGGCVVADFPEMCKSEDMSASLIVVTRDGIVRRFENGPYPIEYEDPLYADGSGRDFAYGAMKMGADARQAVEVACEFDVHCGRGVDSETFDEVK